MPSVVFCNDSILGNSSLPIESNELPLTHEFISKMLGVRRAGVTEAAKSLQQAGLIGYNLGKIIILNGQELEAAACSCYGIIKAEYARLLDTDNG
ncbi:MAG TPA: helix-turn-helix domain-containing protein [Coleofasciculaceae cyanobacterium]|jgi:Mn-dependent DtxR family transcriptional regulator